MIKRIFLLALLACVSLSGTALAGDVLSAGEDNSPNGLEGPVTHDRGYCFDGTYWDRQTCTSTSAPTYVRIQDGTTTALVAVAAGVAANAIRVAPPTNAYFMVSATAAANTLANPMFCQLSGGTAAVGVAVGAPLYASVSKNTTAASKTNPLNVQLSDGTNDIDATHPLPVSATAAANAQGNPIYTAVSDDTAANSAANPIAMLISDGADANAQGHPVYCAVSDDTSANGATNPIVVQLTDGAKVQTTPTAKFDDDAAGNCVAITAASAQFTLPTAGDWYCMSAVGNAAYLLSGADPTATTTVTTGFSTVIPEGATKCRRLTGPKVAVIGAAAAGTLCFEHLNSAL